MPAKNLSRVAHEGSYSHIFNKGIENKIIFQDDEDYQKFISFLNEYLTKPSNPEDKKKTFTVKGRTFRGTPHQPKNFFGKVELLGYSLISNHFHLLLHQIAVGSQQSFIRSLCTRYSMYFNKKYNRKGALFEGPYKSAHIKAEQLLPLVHYIHNDHKDSRYSSQAEYLGKRETSWVKPVSNYKVFIEKYDSLQREIIKDITLETDNTHLERIIPSRNLASSNAKPKRILRIPEYIVITIVFFILTGLGLRNINATNAAAATKNTATAQKEVLSLSVSPVAIEEVPPSPSPQPKVAVIVKAKDPSSVVNIRQIPATFGTKLGEAQNGDTYELISILELNNLEWYEIKLEEGVSGYISSQFSLIQQTNN